MRIESDKRKRPMIGIVYYYLVVDEDGVMVSCRPDGHNKVDDQRWYTGNYFKTERAAEAARDRVAKVWLDVMAESIEFGEYVNSNL